MHSDGGPELVLGRLHATVGDADAAAPPPPLEEEPEPAVAEAAVRLPAVELRFSKAKASHHAPAQITASAAALSSSAGRARLSPVDISALKAFATDLALLAPPSSGVFTAQHARMSLSEALIELAPPSDYFGGAAALAGMIAVLIVVRDPGDVFAAAAIPFSAMLISAVLLGVYANRRIAPVGFSFQFAGLKDVLVDSAPILLADEVAGVIGAAHAGWRGARGPR